MTQKPKGRAGWRQATPKTSDTSHPTATASRVKAGIVTLILWGFRPTELASCIVRRGGLRDV